MVRARCFARYGTPTSSLRWTTAEWRLASRAQGIAHVIGPELGLTLPGSTIVCGDSHTSTHDPIGALAFRIGTSEVEHVFATQTIVQQSAKAMLVWVEGWLDRGVTAKDLILHIIGVVGAGGANGHVIGYAGEAITALDMAGRMTVCNMSIEAGARAGLILADETTYHWLRRCPLAPRASDFDAACRYRRGLRSDQDAVFDRTVVIDASKVEPMVTWGTSPRGGDRDQRGDTRNSGDQRLAKSPPGRRHAGLY